MSFVLVIFWIVWLKILFFFFEFTYKLFYGVNWLKMSLRKDEILDNGAQTWQKYMIRNKFHVFR